MGARPQPTKLTTLPSAERASCPRPPTVPPYTFRWAGRPVPLWEASGCWSRPKQCPSIRSCWCNTTCSAAHNNVHRCFFPCVLQLAQNECFGRTQNRAASLVANKSTVCIVSTSALALLTRTLTKSCSTVMTMEVELLLFLTCHHLVEKLCAVKLLRTGDLLRAKALLFYVSVCTGSLSFFLFNVSFCCSFRDCLVLYGDRGMFGGLIGWSSGSFPVGSSGPEVSPPHIEKDAWTGRKGKEIGGTASVLILGNLVCGCDWSWKS